MKKTLLYVGLLAVMMIAGDKVVAQEKKVLEKQPDAPETYVAPMGTQFVRGIVNMATGWGEYPRQIVLSAKDDGAALCVPYGLARGTWMTVARTFYGAVETVFFYIPFGENYDSAMNPAYVWQDKKDVGAKKEEKK